MGGEGGVGSHASDIQLAWAGGEGGGTGECQCKVSLAGCNCNLSVIGSLPGWFPHCECVAPRISPLLLLTRAWPPVLAHVHLLQYLFAAPAPNRKLPSPGHHLPTQKSRLPALISQLPDLILKCCSYQLLVQFPAHIVDCANPCYKLTLSQFVR